MITIKNTNDLFGDSIEFTADTLEAAVTQMQEAVRACGIDFADAVVTEADYEVVGGITEDDLNRVLPVVADSWEQLRGCDVERLLDSISYDDQDGVADAADIIKAKRPDLATQVDAAAEFVADDYLV